MFLDCGQKLVVIRTFSIDKRLGSQKQILRIHGVDSLFKGFLNGN